MIIKALLIIVLIITIYRSIQVQAYDTYLQNRIRNLSKMYAAILNYDMNKYIIDRYGHSSQLYNAIQGKGGQYLIGAYTKHDSYRSLDQTAANIACAWLLEDLILNWLRTKYTDYRLELASGDHDRTFKKQYNAIPDIVVIKQNGEKHYIEVIWNCESYEFSNRPQLWLRERKIDKILHWRSGIMDMRYILDTAYRIVYYSHGNIVKSLTTKRLHKKGSTNGWTITPDYKILQEGALCQ